MKLNVTCAGCEVSVEEIDGQCVVVAMKDGEVVEEFKIDCEEVEGEEEVSDENLEEMEEELEDMEEELEDMEEEMEEEVSESVKSFEDFFKADEAAE